MQQENPFQNLQKTITHKKVDDWVMEPAQKYLKEPINKKETNLTRLTIQIPQSWYDQIITEILPTMYKSNVNKVKPTLSLYLRNLIEADFKEKNLPS